MNRTRFDSLFTPQGQTALAVALALEPTSETFLSHLSPLQKEFDAELAKAALEMAILRRKARTKFTRADQMYFTRAALEQASGEVISAYRARRYAPFERVADLAIGIGGDTIGLAAAHEVIAVDNDPLRLAMAAENLSAYGRRAQVTFREADLTASALPDAQALWFDPGRRSGERRAFSVRHYQPPLDIIRDWVCQVPALGVKISPGVKLVEIVGYDAEVEFISANGELKECVLWFGALQSAPRRATLLPGGYSLTAAEGAPVRVGAPLAFLYEPDPAVLRAGLVETLARALGAAKLDPDIAYLTADNLQATPFARAFEIEAQLPFSLKRVRAALRERGVGRITVKKRGSPLDVDDFMRAMKLKGDPTVERTVFLTHVQGKPWVLIGRPVQF